MIDTYILEGRTPVPVDPDTWSAWFATADRTVARTTVAPHVEVSTVFLGLDHGWGSGRVLLFESLVFGGVLEGDMYRYATWQEAAQGHALLCHRVRESLAVAGRTRCPPGSLCERCLDAPAVALVPAPWGGERGVCAACAAGEVHGGG